MIESPLLQDAPQKPTRTFHLSRGFKLTLALLAAAALLVGAVSAVNAARTHAQVDALGKHQLFYVLKDIAKGVPTEDATYQAALLQPLGATSFPKRNSKSFVMQVAGKDGYVWSYDSETGFYTSSCTVPGCFFGLAINA